MVRPTLVIHPDVTESRDSICYKFDLRYAGSKRQELLFYEIAGAPARQPVQQFDGVLCGIVLHAMRERLDIRLRGAASETVLRNLREFQLAWSRWLPDTYQPVEIEVDEAVDRPRPTPLRSIAALSGGVDSLFTLFSHNSPGSRPPHRVHAALMVQGFDVALANSDYFSELVDRTAKIREVLGVSLRVARTNSKELRLQKWEDAFAAELAACMHFCSSEFSEGLVGSSEPYDGLVLPWGSNPVSDHLLSGDAMKITHDGAGFSRTDKVAFLAGFPEAMKSLKVCWEGQHQARNCGVCEKCVRTQLNFLAVGVSNPPCFGEPLDLRRIAAVPIRNETLLAEFRSICEYAERRDIDGEWLRLLRARVRRGIENRTLKGMTKTALAKAGLLGPVSKLRNAITR